MESLRKTMDTIIDGKVCPIFKDLSQEDKNKVNDLIYLASCETCSGGSLDKIVSEFEDIAKICDIDISFELSLLAKDIKVEVDKIVEEIKAKEEAKAKKEAEEAKAKKEAEEAKAKRIAEEAAKAKRIVEDAKAKRIVEEAAKVNTEAVEPDNSHAETNKVINEEIIIPSSLSKNELGFAKDLFSKVNKEFNAGEIYKNALASLSELDANSSEIIKLRQEYELVDDKEFVDFRSAILYMGLSKYVMDNKDKLKDVKLDTEEQITMFLMNYALQLNGLESVRNSIKSNMFTLTNTFKDDGTPIYKIMGMEVPVEVKNVIDVNIDTTLGGFTTDLSKSISGPANKDTLNIINRKFDELKTRFITNISISLGLRPMLFGNDATPETAFVNPSFKFDNSKIIDKFPKLKALEELYHMNKLDVMIKETTPNSNFIEFQPYFITNDNESDRKIYVDLGGNLFDRTEKAFLLDNTQTCIEDCVAVKISNTQAISEFIMNGMSNDIKAYDEISDELKSMNKIIDIATLPKNSNADKTAVIDIINSDKCQEKIKSCVSKEPYTRFKLIEYKDCNNFALSSDNSVNQSILEKGHKKNRKFKIVIANKIPTLA